MIKYLLLFCIFLNFANTEAAEISAEKYLNLIIENDAEIEKIIHQKAQTRFNIDMNLPTRSWVFSLTNTYGIPSQKSVNKTSEIQTSLTKNIRDSGTTVTLRYNQNDLADRNEKIQSIQLEQSLIQNAFGLQTRLFEESLSEENKLTNLRLIEAYEDYLAEKLLNYLDFMAAFENLKTSESLLSDINSIWNEVKSRKNKNIALNVDLDRAESESLQYERNKLEAKVQLSNLRKELFKTVNLEDHEGYDFKPQKLIPFIKEVTDLDKTKKVFFKQSRTLEIVETSKKVQEFQEKAVKRDLLPELNFVIGLNEDESTRFATTVNRRETSVGFNLNYEFDNSIDKARHEQSLFNIKLNQIENKSLLNSLRADIENLSNQIKVQKKRVEILEKQSKVTKRLIAAEKKRFKKGLLNLRDLINTQNNYTQVQYDLIQQKVNLAKLVINWKQITDTLIEKI